MSSGQLVGVAGRELAFSALEKVPVVGQAFGLVRGLVSLLGKSGTSPSEGALKLLEAAGAPAALVGRLWAALEGAGYNPRMVFGELVRDFAGRPELAARIRPRIADGTWFRSRGPSPEYHAAVERGYLDIARPGRSSSAPMRLRFAAAG